MICVLLMSSILIPFASIIVMGASDSKFPVEVTVDNGDGTTDTLRLADHTSDIDGNWMSTTGSEGTSITLPYPIDVQIDASVLEKSFTLLGKQVTIDATSLTLPKTVRYPHETHKIYRTNHNIEITFKSNIACHSPSDNH